MTFKVSYDVPIQGFFDTEEFSHIVQIIWCKELPDNESDLEGYILAFEGDAFPGMKNFKIEERWEGNPEVLIGDRAFLETPEVIDVREEEYIYEDVQSIAVIQPEEMDTGEPGEYMVSLPKPLGDPNDSITLPDPDGY